MTPERPNTAMLYIAILSLALNLFVLAVTAAFVYVAVDYMKAEVAIIQDHALRAMGTGYIPRDPKKTPKEQARAAGMEITVTDEGCCID